MDPLRTLVHVGVVLTMSGSMTPTEIASLQSEAARLWSPYGVHLTWFDRVDDCAAAWTTGWLAPVDLLVRVASENDDPAADRGRRQLPPLGSVIFEAGLPDRIVRLRVPAVERLVLGSHLGGWLIGTVPLPLREQLVGRALGRVFAHELGHVLIGMPAHARDGLMRPTFAPADLISPDQTHLRLSGTLLRRLEGRIHTGSFVLLDEPVGAR